MKDKYQLYALRNYNKERMPDGCVTCKCQRIERENIAEAVGWHKLERWYCPDCLEAEMYRR